MPITRVPNPYSPGAQVGAGLDSIARAMLTRPGPYEQDLMQRKGFALSAQAEADQARAGMHGQQGRLFGAQADAEAGNVEFIRSLRDPAGLARNAALLTGVDPERPDTWTPDQTATVRQATAAIAMGLADRTVDPAQISSGFRTARRTRFEGDVFSGAIDPQRGAARGNAASASPAATVRVDGDIFVPTYGTEGMPTDVVKRMFGPTQLGGARIATEGATQNLRRAQAGTEGARVRELNSRTAWNDARAAADALVDIAVTDGSGQPTTVRARVGDVGRQAAERKFTERTRPDGSQPTTSTRPTGANGRPRLYQNEMDQMADTIMALTGATGSMPLQPEARAAIEAEATNQLLNGPTHVRGNVAAATEEAIRKLFPGEDAFTNAGNWDPFTTNQRVPTRPAVRGAAAPVPVPATPVPTPSPGLSAAPAAAVPPAAQRRPGQVYDTPRRGPMKWNGSGWIPADG